ncbi:MAG: hypothetical protein QM765_16460 [Myxococcales bacterium]
MPEGIRQIAVALKVREVERWHQVAVAVVHHAKKGAAKARAGQALRGSP